MFKPELKLPQYYQDPAVLHVGCEENRSYYIPFAPEDTIATSRVQTLNGDWDFLYYSNPFEVEDFTKEGYKYENFDSIPVPGCIQMYGYDHHQYTNVNFPFPYDPPFVPLQNPTCVYHREVYLESATDKQYYLNFEGVDSCFYVYLNGTFVGYSQVSHSTSEFNITSIIKAGVNDITVVVLKWCDGSYLEDQDKFRMTGIFRDVYVITRPIQHVRDYFLKTQLKDNYKKADISIDFSFKDEVLPVKYSLSDAKGKVVAQGNVEAAHLLFEVPEPILWNAENPYLYTLTLTMPDEIIYQKVGIRCVEVINDIIHINGVKVKFKGVNRHDSDPFTGYTISKEQAIKDLKLMKEANINAIRTSHYPNAPWFTGLCSEYGFYVIGESDLEAHGALCFYGAKFPDSYGDLVQREIFAQGVLDRNQRNVVRDKNNSCVVMWSMGNEAGYSKAFEDTGRWIKEYDPTRLLHYESSIHQSGSHVNDTSMLDVFSTMYASVPDIEKYLNNNPKPYMLCEFVHSMGNGPGDIEDYFQCIYENERFVGGFVWEWCDHAIYRGITTKGHKIFHYGGDSGEYPHDGNFCVDGMVSPDRIPHPAYFEYKNVIRPVRGKLISTEEYIIEIENKLDFTNLAQYLTITAELLNNGETIATYDLGSIDLAPHEKTLIKLPIESEKILEREEKVTVKLNYIQNIDLHFTTTGYNLGFDELVLKENTAPFVSAADKILLGESKVRVEESATKIIIIGEKFRYSYDKLVGNFESLVINNQGIIERPVEFNIWRAPTDNDQNIKNEWIRARYNRAFPRVYETSVTSKNGVTQISSRLAITAIQIQHIVDLCLTWYISEEGIITAKVDAKRNQDLPFLPRFGMRFFLPKEYNTVQYLGYGPGESYIDKHRSTWFGAFTQEVSDMHVDYIKPQENSSHWGCLGLNIRSTYGNEIQVSAKTPFSFQTSKYSREELESKAHNYELLPSEGTYFSLDYKMSGVGSNSCGPALSEKYQLNEEDINFEFTLEFGNVKND